MAETAVAGRLSDALNRILSGNDIEAMRHWAERAEELPGAGVDPVFPEPSDGLQRNERAQHSDDSRADASGTTSSSSTSTETTVSVAASGEQGIDGLLKGVRWADGVITYSDPDSVSDYDAGYPELLTDFQQVNAAQMVAVHFALDTDWYTQAAGAVGFSVEGFTDLTIDYAGSGSGAGTIRVANTSDPGTAYAYYPSDSPAGGDAFYGGSGRTPVAGNYHWHTILHELGHTLGLKHGQDTSAYGSMPANIDSMEYSVMTYRSYVGSPPGSYTNEPWGYAQTFMMYDIAALQYLYGADFSTNSGDTVYSWAPNSGDTVINGQIAIRPGGNRIFLTIWDGGGNDTYDLSAYSTNLDIDLSPGGHSLFSASQQAVLGSGQYARGNVFNALLYQGNLASLIENAFGGLGDDTMTGNQADNHLSGMDGSDSLKGGAGDDTLAGGTGADSLAGGDGRDAASYSSQVTVSLDGTLTATGEAAGDTFFMIEELAGSGSSDRLRGDGGANIVRGGGGNDNLEGRAGNDALIGNGGNDRLAGNAGTDTLTGGAGLDDFVFAAPNDSVLGSARDRIIDFTKGDDHIVLTAIDANTSLTGNQAFILDTDGLFSAGEIRQTLSNGNLILELNRDADSTKEMEILLLSMTTKLTASDFEF